MIPYEQNIRFAIKVDTNGDVHSLLHDLSFATDMIVYGIQENNGVDALQGTLLPFLDHGQYLVYHTAYGSVGHLNAVNIPDMGLNITGAHALSVHGENLFFDILADTDLILFQKLRLEFSLAVPGDRYFHIAKAGAKGFTAVAIAAVVGFLVLEGEGCFIKLLLPFPLFQQIGHITF